MLTEQAELSSQGPISPVSSRDGRDIQNLIKASLEDKLETGRKQRTQEEHNNALVATLNEFMKCFTIIGFDLSSDPLIISKANNPLDGEALASLTSKYMKDMVR